VVEASPNLAPASWTTVFTTNALTGSFLFTGTNAPAFGSRFYRVLTP